MSKLPRILPLIAVAIGGVVAVRAVGVAPELFQGAQAWAEEAVDPNAEPAATSQTSASKPAPAVCALHALASVCHEPPQPMGMWRAADPAQKSPRGAGCAIQRGARSVEVPDLVGC